MKIFLMLTQAILLFYGTQLFPPGGRLNIFRFASYGLIISAGLLLSPKFKFKKLTQIDLIAFVLLLFAFCSYLYSIDLKLTLLRSTANLLMYLAVFWVLWVFCRDSNEVCAYIQALMIIWILFYGANVLFLFFRPQDSFQVHEDEFFVAGYQRFTGMTINPNAIGLFSALIFPIVLWSFHKRRGIFDLFLFVAVIFSFFYSFSRDAFICSVIGACIYFYLSTRVHRTFIIICAVFSVVLMISYVELFGFFLPAGMVRSENLMLLGGRIEAWRAALEIIQRRPWYGFGFGTEELLFQHFNYTFQVHSGGTVHNSFLGIALQLGWIAAVVFYGALVAFLIKSYHQIKKVDSKFRPLMSALYASVFSGFLMSFFESWIYSAGGILAFPFFTFLMFLMRTLEFEKNRVNLK